MAAVPTWTKLISDSLDASACSTICAGTQDVQKKGHPSSGCAAS
jgi:hypothetical protein